MLKFDYTDGESATCPKCKESWSDLWDYGWNHQEEIKINCPYCDAQLTLRRIITVDYEIAADWECSFCDGRGKRYFFADKCRDRQCNHGLGDRPMSCPVLDDVCEKCEGSGIHQETVAK